MRTTRAFLITAGLWLILAGPGLAQTLTVTAPNDGSPVTLGAPFDIRWTSTGVTQPLRIFLYKDGERLGIIASDVPVAGGTYRWIGGQYQGGTATEGEGYSIRIRVIGLDLVDASNRTFALRPFGIVGTVYSSPGSGSLRVDAPRAGERFAVGNRVEIRWTSPAPSASGCGNTVRISAVRQGDGRETTIAGYRDNNAGANTYSWYILPPVFVDLLGNYRIRISGGTNCMAESEVFTLAKGSQLLTDGEEINQPGREEGPDPIDAAIGTATGASSFSIEKDRTGADYTIYTVRFTIRAWIANCRPSGAPIEVKKVMCHWYLEESRDDGRRWEPTPGSTRGNNFNNGGFEVGPLRSGPTSGHVREFEVWLPKDPRNEWGGRARYRLRIELDPDRALPDPNRNNNTCYSTAFANPEAD